MSAYLSVCLSVPFFQVCGSRAPKSDAAKAAGPQPQPARPPGSARCQRPADARGGGGNTPCNTRYAGPQRRADQPTNCHDADDAGAEGQLPPRDRRRRHRDRRRRDRRRRRGALPTRPCCRHRAAAIGLPPRPPPLRPPPPPPPRPATTSAAAATATSAAAATATTAATAAAAATRAQPRPHTPPPTNHAYRSCYRHSTRTTRRTRPLEVLWTPPTTSTRPTFRTW